MNPTITRLSPSIGVQVDSLTSADFVTREAAERCKKSWRSTA